MTKAIGYIRVSTEKQADHGVSIEAQTEKLKAYAMLYDIDLVDLVIEQGSAKCLQREGLQSALSRLEAGEAEALIVVKLDRSVSGSMRSSVSVPVRQCSTCETRTSTRAVSLHTVTIWLTVN